MIIGHKKQIKFLENILQSDNIPQSYLFIGPKSVGKFFIAEIFSMALITEETSLKDISEGYNKKKIIDIEILQPEVIEKKGVVKIENIKVEKVREAQKNLALFPMSGKFRILIIDDAQNLNIASQNTLLKTLEEPNRTSIIILIVSEEEKILSTIKSRCRRIDFNLVSLDQIKDSLSVSNDEGVLNKLSIYSMGRPGVVKQLLKNSDNLEERDLVIKKLKEMGTMNNVQKFELAESYAKNLSKAFEDIELWIWFLRIQAYKSLKDKSRLKIYYTIIEKLENVLQKLKKTGVNSRLVLENLFLEL